ncbi:MAG: GGDEF domain-containing protein [Actinomycetota bacterium]|nr:GGDEF domain-containing protein [Actinomycetota bacterium]
MVTWWRQAEQFDWFSGYLHDRGLQLQWRFATFAFTVALAAVPLIMLGSPVGPNTASGAAVAIAAAVCAAAASVVWLFGWPTRRLSVIYSILCSVCIAATCLSLSSAYGALMGCTVFAVLGGFLAYFHAFSHVLANFGLAMACAAISAGRLVLGTGDTALAAAAALIVVALNIGVPFGIFSLVHSLRIDLRNSDRDPLTGLLNRRSFLNAVSELIAAQPPARGVRLNVTMVDLDNFKKLNDTYGHAAGDEALVSVATVLQDQCGPGAALARLGGEEFVVADAELVSRHRTIVERIRAGIAATPLDVTASLGTCSAQVEPYAPVAHPGFVEQLIGIADAAMYESKRAGGDRIAFRELDGLETAS